MALGQLERATEHVTVQQLRDVTPADVLVGSGKLATELDRLDLIDEYRFLVHPRIAGHGPTLYQSGLPYTRRLELVSAKPVRNGTVAMHYRRALTRSSPVAPISRASEHDRASHPEPRRSSEARTREGCCGRAPQGWEPTS